MKKLLSLCAIVTMFAACGDDNSSSATDEVSSSSEETAISSSKEEIASSSSEEQKTQNSSSSNQEVNSSSDTNISNSSIKSSESKAESSSSSNVTESSSSVITETPSVFGDDKFVLKEIPTFGELDGKPYFYTTQSRCTYKNGIFSINPDTSEYAYFYDISNDTLSLYYAKLRDVLFRNSYNADYKDILYGQNNSIEGSWAPICFINLNGSYSDCELNYTYIVTKDTVYIAYPITDNINYEIFEIIEKLTNTNLGFFDEMSNAELATKYAENGVSIDSTGQKTLINVKDKGIISIDEMNIKVKNNEIMSLNIKLSIDNKECVLTSENAPIKSSKYCSEEYLPYLQIDEFDGYVSTYTKNNREEFYTCLENLFN